MISNFTECGMEFKPETPMLVKDYLIFSVLGNFTKKHSFVDDLVLYLFIIKFPYNARSDWLKVRALSENIARVDDGKLAFKFLLRNCDKFAPN